MSDAQVPETTSDQAREIRKGGAGVLVLGILTMVLGFFVMGIPFIAGLAKVIVIGVFLIVGGILELVHTFTGGTHRSKVLGVLGGLLSVLCGGLMLAHPLLGLYVITIVLIAYFLVDGVGRMVLGFQIRPAGGWGIVFASGLITLFLGITIWSQLPEAALWAIGLLVGVRILFAGITMIALGTTVRAVVPKPQDV